MTAKAVDIALLSPGVGLALPGQRAAGYVQPPLLCVPFTCKLSLGRGYLITYPPLHLTITLALRETLTN